MMWVCWGDWILEAFTLSQFNILVSEFPLTYRKLDEDSAHRWRGGGSLGFLPRGSNLFPPPSTQHYAILENERLNN